MDAGHKRDALLRLKTVRGHLDGIIRMVEAEAYCPELMKQVAAGAGRARTHQPSSIAKSSGNLCDRGDPSWRRQRQDRRADRRLTVQRQPDRLSRTREPARQPAARRRRRRDQRLLAGAVRQTDRQAMTAAEQFTATETGEHPPVGRGGVRDPVCGMTVDPESSPHCAEHDDRMYHFCGSRCRERFIAEPSRFLTPAPVAKPSPTASAVPNGPARCTRRSCATARQLPDLRHGARADRPSAGDADNPELRDMTRRFWVSVALSVPVWSSSRWRACRGAAALPSPRRGLGRSWSWPRRWCCGAAGRSSSAAGRRSSTAA